MFLNRLMEEEKVAFLELAHHIAKCDGSISEKESLIIQQYCLEMQIDDILFEETSFDIYSVLEKIKNKKSQKIVALEIMALINADNYFHEQERIVLEKILEKFNLNYHLATVYQEWAKAISSLYIQGNALIEL